MTEKVTRKLTAKVRDEEGISVEFAAFPEGGGPFTSPARPSAKPDTTVTSSVQEPSASAAGVTAEYSEEFLELAIPKLPSLSKANHARLLMQSPNRLYFYWTLAKNPFHTLNRALGQATNYSLVLKLVDLRTEAEEIHPVDAEGTWWFDVDADGEYRAEIGFYAVNRPYVRVLYSNTVATPRKSPSRRSAETAEWSVPAAKFARVLDAAGFQKDAFDIALAGDDAGAADLATRSAFAQFTGKRFDEFSSVSADEIRYAMFALASGLELDQLRALIGKRLFDIIAGLADAGSGRALAALDEQFEFSASEFTVEEEESSAAVFGASLVNFPRRVKKVPLRPGDFAVPGPFGSHSLVS
ncbi:MAG TPA: DUF4912 domain-containing protein [Pyrinomonadaceae bacterium]|nr:DUF4912 domain-containing protein [Pyrinomonadaceae bacterium]